MGLRHTKSDLIQILEASYEVEQPREAWLEGVLRASKASLGNEAGIAGILYDISGGRTLRADGVIGVDLAPGWREMGAEMHASPALAEGIAEGYRKVLCGTLRESINAATADGIHRYFRRFGYDDAVMINGMDVSGVGSALFHFSSAQIHLSARTREVLSRVATHLATGYRLQRRLSERLSDTPAPIEAVLTPGGKVDHAEPPAQSRGARGSLSEAVKQREWARGRARRDDADAVSAWRGLVTARWTLVDCYESGGRRYIVARENAPTVRGPQALSTRERQVLSLAALGRSNKLIAYELDLAHSTVRVLLSRAAAKLGAGSRQALLALWQKRVRTE
jgi:DNA-binding CsgD family transcriptional regulator